MEKKSKPYRTDNEPNGAYVVKEPPTDYGISNPVRYTYADYLSWMDESRREIIDGVAYLFSAPSRFHAEISSDLLSVFKWFVKKRKKKCRVYHAPFDVRLPRNGETANERITTVVQPDICVVCDPGKLDNAGCIGAPDLIVEVQSPSTAQRDLREKFDLYERSGVREYWVVFPRDKGITVYTLQEDGKYDKGTTYEYTGKVPVGIFEGLEIDLKELFED
ncbi:MAG: Uma2 family endonuclease [Dysgonamonadaceae bacterium]|jgi:Uma2 family endonuclease|nr:Uma2 family endonuclease [Dysgonamonadaceae bacterium]